MRFDGVDIALFPAGSGVSKRFAAVTVRAGAVVAETGRILGAADFPIGITCIGVPVPRAHAIALPVEFDKVVAPDGARLSTLCRSRNCC